MGGGDLVTGRRIETGEDLADAMIELGQHHPEAAAMVRELVAVCLRAERDTPGAGLEVIREYGSRWGADEVLDVGQVGEVRAWLASQ